MLPTVPNGSINGGGCHDGFHCLAGGDLVCEWGMLLYLKVASNMAKCHISGGRFEWVRAHLAASLSVRLSRSAIPFICGWYGIVVVCCVPFEFRNEVTVFVLYSGALSEWNFLMCLPCWVCICCNVLVIRAGACEREASGIVTAYLLYSSMSVRTWRWPCDDGGTMGPIVSLDMVSAGWVAVFCRRGNFVLLSFPE